MCVCVCVCVLDPLIGSVSTNEGKKVQLKIYELLG